MFRGIEFKPIAKRISQAAILAPLPFVTACATHVDNKPYSPTPNNAPCFSLPIEPGQQNNVNSNIIQNNLPIEVDIYSFQTTITGGLLSKYEIPGPKFDEEKTVPLVDKITFVQRKPMNVIWAMTGPGCK